MQTLKSKMIGYPHASSLRKGYGCIRILLETGADPNILDKDYDYPYYFAFLLSFCIYGASKILCNRVCQEGYCKPYFITNIETCRLLFVHSQQN